MSICDHIKNYRVSSARADLYTSSGTLGRKMRSIEGQRRVVVVGTKLALGQSCKTQISLCEAQIFQILVWDSNSSSNLDSLSFHSGLKQLFDFKLQIGRHVMVPGRRQPRTRTSRRDPENYTLPLAHCVTLWCVISALYCFG